LPISGDLVEVQALVGEQIAQGIALGGTDVEGIVLGEVGEDSREAKRFDSFGDLGGEVIHIVWQKMPHILKRMRYSHSGKGSRYKFVVYTRFDKASYCRDHGSYLMDLI